ncbi:ADP-ribose pyrophosphatase [Lachnospiraceae bacterium XBD2001]|jgi:ADP-ribose pyrophosphatase|nr:ADP-ribose pyrophosphatase [Lachnospiraceae bacterium XBD2001]
MSLKLAVGSYDPAAFFVRREVTDMSSEEHVTRKSRTLIHAGTIIDYYQDEMLLPNGNTEIWDFVKHRKGAACIVPITKDGKILLVRQFRPALERYTWEIPAGQKDSVGEDPLQCAKRELREETGYDSDHIEKLLSLQSTVAFCNEAIDVYLAKDIYPVGTQQLDDAEAIDCKLWEIEDVLALIDSGKMEDGKTIAGILAALRRI